MQLNKKMLKKETFNNDLVKKIAGSVRSTPLRSITKERNHHTDFPLGRAKKRTAEVDLIMKLIQSRRSPDTSKSQIFYQTNPTQIRTTEKDTSISSSIAEKLYFITLSESGESFSSFSSPNSTDKSDPVEKTRK